MQPERHFDKILIISKNEKIFQKMKKYFINRKMFSINETNAQLA
jgi:hypothetical protein